jgi:hypothetical protein
VRGQQLADDALLIGLATIWHCGWFHITNAVNRRKRVLEPYTVRISWTFMARIRYIFS